MERRPGNNEVYTFRARPHAERGYSKMHIESKFLEGDVIAQEDIDAYVEDVLYVLKDEVGKSGDEDKLVLVMDVLNQEVIIDNIVKKVEQEVAQVKMEKEANGEPFDDHAYLSELVNHGLDQVKRLQQSVLEALKASQLLLPSEILMVEQYFNDQSENSNSPIVAQARDANKKVNIFRDWRPAEYTNDTMLEREINREKEIYAAGMELFMSAKEQHPEDPRLEFFPDIKHFDDSGEGTIVEFRNYTALSDRMAKWIEKNSIPPWREGDIKLELNTVLDAMKGATFLTDYGIVLQDIHPNNIGLDLDTGKGILPDIGGLTADDREYVRIAHKYYFPPDYAIENSDGTAVLVESPTTITEKDMVYQFGRTLEDMRGCCNFSYDSPLYDIPAAMVRRDPNTRTTLRESIETLETYIQTLES